jgi:hypothetical protein
MRLEAEGVQRVFCARCLVCHDEGQGGGTYTCDTVSLMRSDDRRGREMLGTRLGIASCC